MAALELLLKDDEFLIDDSDEFILYEDVSSLDCCCEEEGCCPEELHPTDISPPFVPGTVLLVEVIGSTGDLATCFTVGQTMTMTDLASSGTWLSDDFFGNAGWRNLNFACATEPTLTWGGIPGCPITPPDWIRLSWECNPLTGTFRMILDFPDPEPDTECNTCGGGIGTNPLEGSITIRITIVP